MEYVEQSYMLMNSLNLWAKKVAEKCSEESSDHVLSGAQQLQTEWDAIRSNVAEEKARLESRSMQLMDLEDAVKCEVDWMQDVEQYLASVSNLSSDLSEKKSKLRQTKVDKLLMVYILLG